MKELYYRFMRVTKKGVEVSSLPKCGKGVNLVAKHIEFKNKYPLDIRLGVIKSFIDSGKPCPLCVHSYEADRVTCISCERRFIMKVSKSE